MDKPQLKELQASKILNMSDIYRAVGQEPAAVNTRLGRRNSTIPEEVLDGAEIEIMNRIAKIVSITGLSVIQTVSRILAEAESHEIENFNRVFQSEAVEAIGYYESRDGMVSIFLEDDMYRPRKKAKGYRENFMSVKDIMNLNPQKFELTSRGKVNITDRGIKIG